MPSNLFVALAPRGGGEEVGRPQQRVLPESLVERECRLLARAFLRDDEVGRHRIEPAHHALARGIEGLEIDDEIASIFHVLHLHRWLLFCVIYIIINLSNMQFNSL